MDFEDVMESSEFSGVLAFSGHRKYQLSLIDLRDGIVLYRPSLTITVTNYSGRALELEGIVHLDDRRRFSL